VEDLLLLGDCRGSVFVVGMKLFLGKLLLLGDFVAERLLYWEFVLEENSCWEWLLDG
jgi:hypothetical protein